LRLILGKRGPLGADINTMATVNAEIGDSPGLLIFNSNCINRAFSDATMAVLAFYILIN